MTIDAPTIRGNACPNALVNTVSIELIVEHQAPIARRQDTALSSSSSGRAAGCSSGAGRPPRRSLDRPLIRLRLPVSGGTGHYLGGRYTSQCNAASRRATGCDCQCRTRTPKTGKGRARTTRARRVTGCVIRSADRQARPPFLRLGMVPGGPSVGAGPPAAPRAKPAIRLISRSPAFGGEAPHTARSVLW